MLSQQIMSNEYPKLIAMVGLPRSGKSTWVHGWYIPHGYSAVSPDMIRRVIHGRSYLESMENHVWSIVYAMADALLAMGNHVVIDSTNCTRHSRDTWTRRGALFHYVATPSDVCITRGQGQANAIDIVPTIERMIRRFEPLDADEPIFNPNSTNSYVMPTQVVSCAG